MSTENQIILDAMKAQSEMSQPLMGKFKKP